MWEFPILQIPFPSNFDSISSNILEWINVDNFHEHRAEVIEALIPQTSILESKWNLASVSENIGEIWVERIIDEYTGVHSGGGMGLTCRWVVDCFETAEVKLRLGEALASIHNEWYGKYESKTGDLLIFPSYVPYISSKPPMYDTQTTVICFNIQYQFPCSPLKMLSPIFVNNPEYIEGCNAVASGFRHMKDRYKLSLPILHLKAPANFQHIKDDIIAELAMLENCTPKSDRYGMNTDFYDSYSFDLPKYCQKVLDSLKNELKIIQNTFSLQYPICTKTIAKMWFQSTANAQHHEAHTHGERGDEKLSFVWYIEFDPTVHRSTTFYCPFRDPVTGKLIKSDIPVDEGDLVVFPSSIVHEQLPSYSNVRRTIISFNHTPYLFHISPQQKLLWKSIASSTNSRFIYQ